MSADCKGMRTFFSGGAMDIIRNKLLPLWLPGLLFLLFLAPLPARAADDAAMELVDVQFDLRTQPVRVLSGLLPLSVSTEEDIQNSTIMEDIQVILTVLPGSGLSEGATGSLYFALQDVSAPVSPDRPNIRYGADHGDTDIEFIEADADGAAPFMILDASTAQVGANTLTVLFWGNNAGSDENNLVLEAGDQLVFTIRGLSGVTLGDNYDSTSEEDQSHITVEVSTSRGDPNRGTMPAVGLRGGGSLLREPLPLSEEAGHTITDSRLVIITNVVDPIEPPDPPDPCPDPPCMVEPPDPPPTVGIPPGVESGDLTYNLFTRPAIFAAELFGAAGLTLGQDSMQVVLTLNGAVSTGGASDLEFRLSGGAQFGGQLSSQSLSFEEADTDGATHSTEITAGGAGSDRVTFQLTTTGHGTDEMNRSLERGDRLIFTIPALQNVTLPASFARDSTTPVPVESIRVSLHTRVVVSVGGFNFLSLAPLTHGEGGNSIGQDILFSVMDRFTLTAAAPENLAPTIDVSNPASFKTGATSISLQEGRETVSRQGLHLASLSIAINNGSAGRGNPRQSNGMEDFNLTSADQVLLALTGEFGPSDLVFVDINNNQMLDEGERISVEQGLVLGTEGAGTDRFSTLSPAAVYLLADDERSQQPGDYSVIMLLNFSPPSYRDDIALSDPVVTSYDGIFQDGFAYNVPSCLRADRARIRVTNETRDPLRIFVQGVDHLGTDLGFAEVDVSILRDGEARLGPLETVMLSTARLEQIFGLNDGNFPNGQCVTSDTWVGRAQLTFFSDGNITITPLIRGADGQLRDLGGFTGLGVNDGMRRQTVSN